MEKRKSRRLAVNVEVKLLSGGNHYEGTIENISMDGIFMHMTTAPAQSAKDFVPSTIIQIKFQPAQGNHLDIQCNVRWLHIHEEAPDNLVHKMGVEILDPPSDYKDWVKTILAD
jgi:hypothetical protein